MQSASLYFPPHLRLTPLTMTRYDPVKDCVQDAHYTRLERLDSTETVHQRSSGRAVQPTREEVASRLFEYRDNVASTSSLFISNATSHGFESRDATSTLFQSRIPYAHPPSPAASHRSDSYLLMRSPSLPSIKLFMEDPHARFLKNTISTESMRQRYSSRDSRSGPSPHPYSRQSSRSSSRASTVDFSEGEESDTCSSLSESSHCFTHVMRPPNIFVPSPDMEIASPLESSRTPFLSSSESSPAQSDSGYDWSREPHHPRRVQTPLLAGYNFQALPLHHYTSSAVDNDDGQLEIGRIRSRNTKADPADKFLVESIVDGVRIYRCNWSKPLGETGGGIPCGHKASRSNARQHVKSRHLKLRPYVCPECGRTWRDQGARYNHRVREHGYVPKKPKKWDAAQVDVRSNDNPWSVAFVMDPNSPCKEGDGDVLMTSS